MIVSLTQTHFLSRFSIYKLWKPSRRHNNLIPWHVHTIVCWSIIPQHTENLEFSSCSLIQTCSTSSNCIPFVTRNSMHNIPSLENLNLAFVEWSRHVALVATCSRTDKHFERGRSSNVDYDVVYSWFKDLEERKRKQEMGWWKGREGIVESKVAWNHSIPYQWIFQ